MRFGRQRAPRDYAAITLLFLGFCGLALAFWLYTDTWAGLLLPLGFLVGAFAQLRTEVRELELLDDRLIVRTFFRSYPMPRAHIRGVVRVPEGTAVEVVNGSRYVVSPADADADEVLRALQAWLG